jgi:hypothetical protein
MNGDSNNGKNGTLANFLYRSALLGMCSILLAISGWVLHAVLDNNKRSIKMEADISHSNEAVARMERGLEARVTRQELELETTKLRNEQLKVHNEFLRITQPNMLVPPRNQHTGR